MFTVATFALVVASVYSAPVGQQQETKLGHSALQKPEFVVIHLTAPQFLEDATPEGRKQFAEIIMGSGRDHETIQQTFDALNKWATAQGPKVKAAYDQTKEKVKAAVADVRAAIEKSTLSDAAKQGFAKIGAVLADHNQTRAQVYAKINSVLESLPKNVVEEMNEYTESVAEAALLKLKAQVAKGSL